MSAVPLAQTGADSWRYELPCGHRPMRRQVSYPKGRRGRWRCLTCGQLWAYRYDLTTGRREA